MKMKDLNPAEEGYFSNCTGRKSPDMEQANKAESCRLSSLPTTCTLFEPSSSIVQDDTNM